MSNILSDIYRAQYYPQEQSFCRDGDYCVRNSAASRLRDQLEMELEGEMKDKFRQYLRMEAEMGAMEEERMFIEGVRMGVKLMTGVFGTE